MAFSIRDHRLFRDARAVDFLRSPYVGAALPEPTKILVIHFTFGGTGRSSADWFRDPLNKGSSAHVVVDRDGSVIQCVPFNIVAWHAGRSRWGDLVGLNQFALSIELANWGYLKRSGAGWASYTGMRISDPFIGVHKNGNPDGSRSPIGWEPYSEAQLSTAIQIARVFVDTYGVKEIVGHDDIAPDRKWDPGPAFDMMRFCAQVFGDRGYNGDIRMKVLPSVGLNLRAEPGTQYEVKKLLAMGTIVQPIERDMLWISVSEIGPSGEPTDTGWVHSQYLGDV